MEDNKLIKEADTAEPATIVYKLLEVGWYKKKLYSGDYRFYSHNSLCIGITRKTILDLLASINSIFGNQLEEMEDFYDIKIILVEGGWSMISPAQRIVSNRGIEYSTWDMVWNFLRTWQDRGFSLELTINEGHTIQRLNSLYAYYQKPFHTGATKNIIGDDRILALPKGCRGKAGVALLGKFGSLRNLANATIEDYLTVDKIGDKKAQAILNHFAKENPK
jgi:ERCC4-type nuclease